MRIAHYSNAQSISFEAHIYISKHSRIAPINTYSHHPLRKTGFNGGHYIYRQSAMNVENFPGIRSVPDVIGVCRGIRPTRQETLDTSMEIVIVFFFPVCFSHMLFAWADSGSDCLRENSANRSPSMSIGFSFGCLYSIIVFRDVYLRDLCEQIESDVFRVWKCDCLEMEGFDDGKIGVFFFNFYLFNIPLLNT